MKVFFITLLLLVTSATLLAQAQTDKYSLELPKDNLIEINGGGIINNVIRFESTQKQGDAENGYGFSFGILYSRKITNKLMVGGGYSYMSVNNNYVRATTLEGSGDETYRKKITTAMWSIPFHARYNFQKWAFASAGFSFDFQGANRKSQYIDNQTGMSVFASLGVNFNVWNSFYVGVEPRVTLTSLAAFRSDDYQQHFINYSAILSVSYLF